MQAYFFKGIMLQTSVSQAITQFNSVSQSTFSLPTHAIHLSFKLSPQHFCHWTRITGELSLILFSSFRRNLSQLFYLKCSHHFEAIFKITDIFISPEANTLFLAFAKQKCNPCCFQWVGIFKSYFENYCF